MRALIIVATLCLGSTLLWSQDRRVTLASLDQLAHMSPARPGFMTFDNDGMQFEGTPFLFDDWRNGRVKLKEQDVFSEQVGVILDLQDNRIYVQLASEFVSEFPVEKIRAVEIYNEQDTLLYETYDLGNYYGVGPKGIRFYQILHRGDYTLLHGEKKYLRREEYVEKFGIVERPNEFKSIHSYWLDNGRTIKKLKKRKSGLKDALYGKDARKAKRIIKANDLNIKKDEDLASFFAILEQENKKSN